MRRAAVAPSRGSGGGVGSADGVGGADRGGDCGCDRSGCGGDLGGGGGVGAVGSRWVLVVGRSRASSARWRGGGLWGGGSCAGCALHRRGIGVFVPHWWGQAKGGCGVEIVLDVLGIGVVASAASLTDSIGCLRDMLGGACSTGAEGGRLLSAWWSVGGYQPLGDRRQRPPPPQGDRENGGGGAPHGHAAGAKARTWTASRPV